MANGRVPRVSKSTAGPPTTRPPENLSPEIAPYSRIIAMDKPRGKGPGVLTPVRGHPIVAGNSAGLRLRYSVSKGISAGRKEMQEFPGVVLWQAWSALLPLLPSLNPARAAA